MASKRPVQPECRRWWFRTAGWTRRWLKRPHWSFHPWNSSARNCSDCQLLIESQPENSSLFCVSLNLSSTSANVEDNKLQSSHCSFVKIYRTHPLTQILLLAQIPALIKRFNLIRLRDDWHSMNSRTDSVSTVSTDFSEFEPNVFLAGTS